MKKIGIILLFCSCFLATSINADEIDVSGSYLAGSTRSLIKPIQAFISNQSLEVDFNSTVETIVISIYDENGNIVYQQSENATAGQKLLIDISTFDAGNYTIEFENSQTNMSGNFEI